MGSLFSVTEAVLVLIRAADLDQLTEQGTGTRTVKRRFLIKYSLIDKN
jgi:hypothetical protein